MNLDPLQFFITTLIRKIGAPDNKFTFRILYTHSSIAFYNRLSNHSQLAEKPFSPLIKAIRHSSITFFTIRLRFVDFFFFFFSQLHIHHLYQFFRIYGSHHIPRKYSTQLINCFIQSFKQDSFVQICVPTTTNCQKGSCVYFIK